MAHFFPFHWIGIRIGGQLLDVSQSFGTAADGGDICIRQPRLPFQLPKCFHTQCSCISINLNPPPAPLRESISFRRHVVLNRFIWNEQRQILNSCSHTACCCYRDTSLSSLSLRCSEWIRSSPLLPPNLPELGQPVICCASRLVSSCVRVRPGTTVCRR